MADPILISSRVFIPKKLVKRDDLEQYYEYNTYNEQKCQKCPIYKAGDRHCPDCDSCPGFLGLQRLWRSKEVKGKPYYALPPGNLKKIEKLLDVNLSKAKDLRPIIPFTSGIKWKKSFKLYTGKKVNGKQTVDQKSVVNTWLLHKGGIIRVPPRGGKTVMSLRGAFKLGCKTIIVANENRLLKQFYNQIVGQQKI